MKRLTKVLAVVTAAALVLSFAAGCSTGGSQSDAEDKTIVVGATPTPHAEILEVAKEELTAKGYTLEIKEFTDYILPNQALSNKEIDANYFQHQPYLDDYNAENKTDLVSVASIHYEPMGIFAGKTKALADVKEGAVIGVPNDTTNEARALLLLEANGLIKLKEGAGLAATVNDITENKLNLKIQELEAAQLSRSLADMDLAVINGNYALDAGLKVTDALATEAKDSEAAKTFANIICVRPDDVKSEKIAALVEVLQGEKVTKYIEETYGGSVVPMK